MGLPRITEFDRDDRGKEGLSKGDKFKAEADLFDDDWMDAGRSRAGCEITEYDGGGDIGADCWSAFKFNKDDKIVAGGAVNERTWRTGFSSWGPKAGKGTLTTPGAGW